MAYPEVDLESPKSSGCKKMETGHASWRGASFQKRENTNFAHVISEQASAVLDSTDSSQDGLPQDASSAATSWQPEVWRWGYRDSADP